MAQQRQITLGRWAKRLLHSARRNAGAAVIAAWTAASLAGCVMVTGGVSHGRGAHERYCCGRNKKFLHGAFSVGLIGSTTALRKEKFPKIYGRRPNLRSQYDPKRSYDTRAAPPPVMVK